MKYLDELHRFTINNFKNMKDIPKTFLHDKPNPYYMKCNRNYRQFQCSALSLKNRYKLINKLISKECKILLVGDDDFLSIELFKHNFLDITVIDIDQRVLDKISSVSKNIKVHNMNILDESSVRYLSSKTKYNLVFFDPMYTDTAYLFLSNIITFFDPNYVLMSFMEYDISTVKKKIKDDKNINKYNCLVKKNFNYYMYPKVPLRIFSSDLCIFEKPNGYHYLIKVSNCSCDINKIKVMLDEFGMPYKIIDVKYKIFENGGYTQVMLLETSHISVHTWIEYKMFHMDLFTCEKKHNIKDIKQIITKYFKNSLTDIKYINR
jgi:S-adenosylmethionine/arginine decarboxylase-like enzyme